MKVKGVEVFLRQHPEFLENIPCPFCGELPAPTRKINEHEFVHCGNFGCRLYGLEFTKEVWNKRPGEEALSKELVDVCYRSLDLSTKWMKLKTQLDKEMVELGSNVEKLKKHIGDLIDAGRNLVCELPNGFDVEPSDAQTKFEELADSIVKAGECNNGKPK